MVKLSDGAWIQPSLTGTDGLARHEQVYRTVREAIVGGRLAAGCRLPAARQLARDWGVARGAVDQAFDQLQADGLVVRRIGDGSYVASPLPLPIGRIAAAPRVRPPSRSAQQVLARFAPYVGQSRRLDLMQDRMSPRPLFPRAPFVDDFPIGVWRRLMGEALGEHRRELLNYGAAVGAVELREAIARHLALTRGMACSAGQVMVVNGPMQGIELVSRVLLEPGDEVWVEDPGFGSVPALFRVLHQRPVPVPVDERGLDVQAGRRLAPGASAVYFHPLVQFPTGWRTDARRRRELIDWADESGAWIVEGNFNDELAHDRLAPPDLHALDRSERVITMGTFEGILFPSLRVGYLVVPERLMPVFTAMRGLMGDHTSAATQAALARFLDDGHMARRLRALRVHLKAQRSVFERALRRELPASVRCGPLDGDGHACLHLAPELPDMAVARELRQRGVSSFALSSTCMQPQSRNGLVVAYAPYAAAQVEQAIAELGVVLSSRGAAATAP